MELRLLEPDDARWSEFLARAEHDLFQLPSFLGATAGHEGGEGRALLAEEAGCGLLLPFALRPIPGSELRDGLSPYGFPGPLLAPDCPDPGFPGRALAAGLGFLAAEGIVSLFVRLNPVLDFPLEELARHGTVVCHGDAVSVDLTLEPEEILKGMRYETRRRVRRLGEKGYEFRMSFDPADLASFLAVYEESMDRLEASSYYYFPASYFSGLFAALPGGVHLAFVSRGDRVAASGLFLGYRSRLHYFLSGTSPDFLSDSPMRLLLYRVMLWGREQGFRLLHLGGGRGGERDSLFEFKAGFSDRRHAVRTWRAVTDEEAYRALVDDWEARHGRSHPGPEEFFPAYRAAGESA